MKNVGTADEQTALDEFRNSDRAPDWDSLRKTILKPFHEGVECLLNEIVDRGGMRQPVIAALDITYWEFYPSPYKDEEDFGRTSRSS